MVQLGLAGSHNGTGSPAPPKLALLLGCGVEKAAEYVPARTKVSVRMRKMVFMV